MNECCLDEETQVAKCTFEKFKVNFFFQPIKQIIPDFGNRTPGKEQYRLDAAKKWQEIQEILIDILRQTAVSAESKGLFNAQQRHVYFRSGRS